MSLNTSLAFSFSSVTLHLTGSKEKEICWTDLAERTRCNTPRDLTADNCRSFLILQQAKQICLLPFGLSGIQSGKCPISESTSFFLVYIQQCLKHFYYLFQLSSLIFVSKLWGVEIEPEKALHSEHRLHYSYIFLKNLFIITMPSYTSMIFSLFFKVYRADFPLYHL